jgi:hypothetical protein
MICDVNQQKKEMLRMRITEHKFILAWKYLSKIMKCLREMPQDTCSCLKTFIGQVKESDRGC